MKIIIDLKRKMVLIVALFNYLKINVLKKRTVSAFYSKIISRYNTILFYKWDIKGNLY